MALMEPTRQVFEGAGLELLLDYESVDLVDETDGASRLDLRKIDAVRPIDGG